MSERVKVAVRLRPLIEEELTSKDKSICIEVIDPQKKVLIIKKDFEKRQFQFDNVFDPKATQGTVYNEIARGVVGSVVKGFNGTIFCYGQTGTGKTYTIMGKLDSEERGITPRTFEQIFSDIASDPSNSYSVQLGYLQIYMEMVSCIVNQLLDLIRPDNQEVKIRECPDSGVFVSGLEWLQVESPQECLSIMNFAEKNKVVAFTNLNAHSSRSHSMLIIKVERRALPSTTLSKKPSSKSYSQELTDESSSVGTLYLVDLAGSERIKKSRATGDRLSEARSINYSLTALGKCIHALTGPKSTFVPFRDSKLTRILQDALGGNCKTALIVNIGPAGRHVEETLSSLTFGMRAMKVTNTPYVNQTKDFEVLNIVIQQIAQQLQMELELKDEQIAQLEQQQLKLIQKLGGDLKDSGTDNMYKMKLEKAEEEHKQFLEEIDKMMVDQEQENEELKKQMASLMLQLEEAKNKESFMEQEIEEFKRENQEELEQAVAAKEEAFNTIQDLHNLIEQRDKEIQELRSGSLKCQSDVINRSKEKQNQMWRSELQAITSQYANKLEEVKRLEFQQTQFQEKENNNNILSEQKSKIEELQYQLKALKGENTQFQEKEFKLLETNSQLNEYIHQQQEQAQQEQYELCEQIKNLEQVNGEITKRLEQYEHKLKKQQQNEFAYQQEMENKNQLLNQIQQEYNDIQKQFVQIKEQYATIVVVNQNKMKQLTNEIQQVMGKNQDLQMQIQQLLQRNSELQMQIHQDNKSSIYQTNQSYVNEQNFEIELKKSITVSGVNEGQIVVEMQARIQQSEEVIQLLQQELQYKEKLISDLQMKCSKSQMETEQLRFQMDSFSRKSQQSLQKMEETMCQEVVRSVLEKIVIQVELNSLEQDDQSSKAPDSDLKLQMKSFSKQENAQLVESLFINSRRSGNNAIVECEEEEDSQQSEVEYQLPKFSQSGSKLQQQLRMSKSRQDSVFSFSEKQQKKDAISVYDDLSEIHQQSPRSQLDEIQFQIDFNDTNAVEKFMSQIKKRQVSLLQNDLSVGSIQQAQSNQKLQSTSEKKNEELHEVIKVMAQMLVEKSESNNTLETLRASMLDFNNLCNTLTTYFL